MQKYSMDVLCLNCAQHIPGRQVRPLEEKRTAVPAGKLKKTPGFGAVPGEGACNQNQGKWDELCRKMGMRAAWVLPQKR